MLGPRFIGGLRYRQRSILLRKASRELRWRGSGGYGASPVVVRRIGDRALSADASLQAPSRLRVRLEVPSMHCGGCVSTVEAALQELDQASHVSANLAARTVVVSLPSPRPTDDGSDVRGAEPDGGGGASGAGSGGIMIEGAQRTGDGEVSAGGAAVGEVEAAVLGALEGAGFGIGSRVVSVVAEAPLQMTFDVPGIHCGGCVSSAEAALEGVVGVSSVVASATTRHVTVTLTADASRDADVAATETRIRLQLAASGFPAEAAPASLRGGAFELQKGNPGTRGVASPEEQYLRDKKTLQRRAWAAGALVAASVASHATHMMGPSVLGESMTAFVASNWLHASLATVALVGPGARLLQSGAASLLRGRPDMHSLLSMGVMAAYGSSMAALAMPQLGWGLAFDEAVMVLGFVLAGQALEARARLRAALSLQKLLKLQPDAARVVPSLDDVGTPHADSVVNSSAVYDGMLVRVLAGDRFPVDGVIVHGASSCDRSSLTGESVPVSVTSGDSVDGGTVNLTGSVVVRATASASQSAAARIAALVQEAQGRKASIQRLADTVAGGFSWGVLGVAGTAWVFWGAVAPAMAPWVLEAAWQANSGLISVSSASAAPSPAMLATRIAADVMIVACPCALGLATPTAILVGSGAGAERGIVLRGADILEASAEVSDVIFDKTGTLTTGNMRVHGVTSVSERAHELPAWLFKLVQDSGRHPALLVAALCEEGMSRHPVAAAIVSEATGASKSTGARASDVTVEAGLGISASVEGDAYVVGSWRYMQRAGVRDAELEACRLASETIGAEGHVPVFVAQRSTRAHNQLDDVCPMLLGVIAVGDALRPEAAATVAVLQGRGIRVHILSGDTAAAASAVAGTLGISPECVHAEVLPDGKATIVERITSEATGKVAMVGDGINDAPALTVADIGITMSSSSDVAVDCADIVLSRGTLADIPRAFTLSKLTMSKVKQNLAWAFAYNSVALPVAAGALIWPFGIVLSPAVAGAAHAVSSIGVIVNSVALSRTLRHGALDEQVSK